MTAGLAGAQEASQPSSVVRQSLDDAWWTGPMLAPNATTLPRGHLLIEPYLFDAISAHSNGLGSLTYVNYGLVDRVTVGLIPIAGFNVANSGPSSSSVELGDLTAQAQYRLAKFHEGSSIPTTSVVVQETFPTGKYDRLGDRPDGLGSGAYTTTLAIYTQTYFWLPNGRILRMRFDASQALSSNVNIEDVSVYDTAAGFRGRAKPGSSFLADFSWEYSLTRKWVLALDATYRHNWSTRVNGYNPWIPAARRIQRPAELRLCRDVRLRTGDRIQLEAQPGRAPRHPGDSRQPQYKRHGHPGGGDQLRPLNVLPAISFPRPSSGDLQFSDQPRLTDAISRGDDSAVFRGAAKTIEHAPRGEGNRADGLFAVPFVCQECSHHTDHIGSALDEDDAGVVS